MNKKSIPCYFKSVKKIIYNSYSAINTLNNQPPLVNINNPEEDIPSNLCNCNVFYTSPMT